ncbi:hypothetical protein ACHAXT_013073 [Thalassiosira profunda]
MPSHDEPPEHEEADTSPESAAVVRGAARTAASSGTRSAAAATRGAMAGRLPSAASRTAAKASKAMGRAPKMVARRGVARGAPRGLPRAAAPKKISLSRAPRGGAPRGAVPRSTPKLSARIPKARANTIAKASDRASKGMDVLSAGLEETSESNAKGNLQAKKSAQLTNAMRRIASFGRTFLANTVLGIAVFETYEGIIERVAPPSANERNEGDAHDNFSMSDDAFSSVGEEDKGSEQLQTHSIDIDDQTDAMDRATLPQHFFAGAMGGASHAVLSLALEVKVNASGDALSSSAKGSNYTLTNPLQPQKALQIQVPAMRYSASSILHHSLAHSVLFGSYQGTKRLLLHATNDPADGHSDGKHIASIAMAGGLAGQLQHIMSHFTEQMLGLTEETKISPSATLLRRLRPTWRSTMLAFPASAVGFLAFEYGKVMMTGDNLAEK